MREVIKILFVGLLFLILAACGNTAKNLQQQTVNERTDVFTELRNGDMPEPDFAVLIVRGIYQKSTWKDIMRLSHRILGNPAILSCSISPDKR